MKSAHCLIVAMAAQCRGLIQQSAAAGPAASRGAPPKAPSVFDQVKIAYGGGGEDEDLIDHLAVEMDIGGQG